MPTLNKAVSAAIAGLFAATSISIPAQALSKSDILSLSYEQVKGSGLANRCAEVSGTDSIPILSKLKVTDLCLEPTSWQVLQAFCSCSLMPHPVVTIDNLLHR